MKTIQTSRQPVNKFKFSKRQYVAKITFDTGKSNTTFNTEVSRIDLINKGCNDKGLFVALVEIADRMELPKPRHYHIEDLD